VTEGPTSPWPAGDTDTDIERPSLARGHAFEAFEWIDVTVAGADWAMEMAVTPRVVNSSGVLQGGLLATLIDMVAGVALLRGDHGYGRAATSEMHISYLAGARVGPVRAEARILRRGYRTGVVRVDVYDAGADDLYVAAATLSFSVKQGDPVDFGDRGPTGASTGPDQP
jgi:uncharacterized protein (TIGR00369 family)